MGSCFKATNQSFLPVLGNKFFSTRMKVTPVLSRCDSDCATASGGPVSTKTSSYMSDTAKPAYLTTSQHVLLPHLCTRFRSHRSSCTSRLSILNKSYMAKRRAGATSSSPTTSTSTGQKCATSTLTSSVVISFFKELFSRWGPLKKIITDNSKQFVSHNLKKFFKSLHIKHTGSALYHPQANYDVVRFNRFLTN